MFGTIQKLRHGWNYLNIMKSKTMEHVSNEEKAKEIARFNREFYDEGGANQKYSEEECYKSAIAMAEWKDEQLWKELFELSLSSNLYDYLMWVCNKKKELEEQLKINSNEK